MVNRLVASTLAGLAVLATPAVAQPAAFHFRSLEFMPSEQRLPAAQHFVSRVARPGTPLALAQSRLVAAGARCKAASGPGDLRCEYDTMEHHTGDPMRDIAWKVRLMSDGTGHVTGAAVERAVYGA